MVIAMKALVLDDDPLVLALLSHLLAFRGYDVASYADPRQCPLSKCGACPCALRQAGCPDLILTDVNMPSMSGVEFVSELKHKGCQCPNIAMISGDWSESNLALARQLGVEVFSKPCDLPRLDVWARRILGDTPAH